ncbi:DUF6113 family protein [Isoptericola sp. NPDC019482]|uniref:DUF6113 family protein n=1 Tax=Isoptericola sp. NPDC019482 TaxID=3154688 RepID=UPI003493FD9B
MTTPEHATPTPPPAAPAGAGRWWRSAARTVLAVALGAVVGVLGTVAHRTQWQDLPVGIVLALAITLSTAVLCRAWAGLGPLLAAGAGWVVAVQVLAVAGPGGDVLVPAQPVGLVWTYGGLAMFLVAAFLPRSWFSDRRG